MLPVLLILALCLLKLTLTICLSLAFVPLLLIPSTQGCAHNIKHCHAEYLGCAVMVLLGSEGK
jgi:hypothetical protein